MLRRPAAIQQINALGKSHTPFLFFTDFLGTSAFVCPLDQLQKHNITYAFGDQASSHSKPNFAFSKQPLLREEFALAFRYVVDQINFGNSYLVNLTVKTPITTNLSLQEIYAVSKAKYKLRYQDQFVFFSPETFVKIEDGHIYSYPMKGTLDAAVPNARQQLLNDPKETAEHVTIVDLIRNDLSQIAEKVAVTKFRFITEVQTHEKTLLQVSSEIRGQLPQDYHSRLGTLLFKLLPAGSISGAPKKETVQIIANAETYERGFYTGICGVYDGQNLDSGVMIRFIEKENNQLYYKSGGGITSFSNEASEYQEVIDKIYIPC
ncbi:aminodeoxychorismate synthase subunit I [Marinoscillum furvescens DSM 4134]|uniref:Aminodeoxychorismate synthase subunit I n=2 Tax=Marinoscillum furvescens TaxID=1026 RepID=A0A3D9LHR4_MARFU|nr:aminodeoxychorismate synthase subunit I [Marinoscillum furvescens DSM 4134]